MRGLTAAITLLAFTPLVEAGSLCTDNTFTLREARQGMQEYNSSCGLCHLYDLGGRTPGNAMHETPDIGLLTDTMARTLGVIPPLVGAAFPGRWKDQAAFSDRISNAIKAFPPAHHVNPDSDVRIAAYILYREAAAASRGPLGQAPDQRRYRRSIPAVSG